MTEVDIHTVDIYMEKPNVFLSYWITCTTELYDMLQLFEDTFKDTVSI